VIFKNKWFLGNTFQERGERSERDRKKGKEICDGGMRKSSILRFKNKWFFEVILSRPQVYIHR
jgi:hypothetical protein